MEANKAQPSGCSQAKLDSCGCECRKALETLLCDIRSQHEGFVRYQVPLPSVVAVADAALASLRAEPARHGMYFASKTKHAADWRALRDAGYAVSSTWIDEAGEGESDDYAELSSRCLSEIRRSAALILCCRPGEILKGALLEAGAALAFGVPVFCVAPADCESISRVFRKHPLWRDFETLREAIDASWGSAAPAVDEMAGAEELAKRDEEITSLKKRLDAAELGWV